MRPIILLVAFTILAACAQSSTGDSAEELTSEAQSILRDKGRSEYNTEAMKLLDRAIEFDPDYLPARQERLNQYLAEQEIRAAVEESGEIVRIKDIPETRLFHCMLREFKNPDFEDRKDCYSSVAESIATRNKPHTDLNYVLALKLADSPAFKRQAKRHLDNLEHREVKALAEKLLFEKSRKQLIRAYLPIP